MCPMQKRQFDCEPNLVEVVDHEPIDQVFRLGVLRFRVEIALVLKSCFCETNCMISVPIRS